MTISSSMAPYRSPVSPFAACNCHPHGHPSLDEIYPNLFLGNLYAAEDVETLKENGITHIITIASHAPIIPSELGIRHKFYQMHDDHHGALLDVLPEAVTRLEWVLTNGDCGLDGKGGRSKVLVHCFMGISRSAAVVVGYAMKVERCTLEVALEKVQARRHVVKPNHHFLELLRVWGKMRYSPWAAEDAPKPKKLEVESEWVEIAEEEDEWEM